ncbi:MAG: dihydrodipicolinate synthase family protein [Chloroflexi bacterium]|nr:dihydrodipicolinate synthase family protein [Chloroflexota bacterium]
MLTREDVHGVMGMMPAFATPDAGEMTAVNTVDVDNLRDGVDRIIKDGIDVIATTGSFGECYNLMWDEYSTLIHASIEAVNKRVPLFLGCTSTNPREVVQKMKLIQDAGGEGVLLGVPYYDQSSVANAVRFYHDIAELFPKLGILIYHNPENHKFTIPVSAYHKLIESPNIIGTKDSHRDTRAFIQLQKIIRGHVSVMVNQAQMYPFVAMGAAGCWSIDAWMGPWPVLYLRDLIERGEDEEAQRVIGDLMGSGGGGRPGADEGSAGKLTHQIAGYVNPGPNRPPFLEVPDAAVERAKARAAYWTSLCDKYRPLVEASQKVATPA